MASLQVTLRVAGVTVADVNVTFPNADANDMLAALKVGGATDTDTMTTEIARWFDQLERKGNSAAITKAVNAAVATATAKVTEKITLRGDPVIKAALLAGQTRDNPPPSKPVVVAPLTPTP